MLDHVAVIVFWQFDLIIGVSFDIVCLIGYKRSRLFVALTNLVAILPMVQLTMHG